ncbi:MAG: CPBP family intramembrane metalloprotease [Planctomycetaceae bacterium]|nr:CPBP family intramembrane metalloprotease [Planctomycetaceae bacterium]
MTEESSIPENDYWSEARRPLSCLTFLIPWILVYEAGVLFVAGTDADAVRNGADFWLRSLLSGFGLQSVLLPGLVAGVLLVWHVSQKYPWNVRLETIAGMFAESLILAIALVVFGQLHDFFFRQITPAATDTAMITNSISPAMTRAVSFIGAGVYEEVMFRLLMVPAAMVVFRMFEFPWKWAAVMAAVSTSFLFALAHHVGPTADAFNLFTFSFRAAAGLFFATIFLLRGIGITVGCHAAYDLLVGVLLTTPSTEYPS